MEIVKIDRNRVIHISLLTLWGVLISVVLVLVLSSRTPAIGVLAYLSYSVLPFSFFYVLSVIIINRKSKPGALSMVTSTVLLVCQFLFGIPSLITTIFLLVSWERSEELSRLIFELIAPLSLAATFGPVPLLLWRKKQSEVNT